MAYCSPETCRMSPSLPPWLSISKDHRMIWVEKDFNAHLVPTLLHGQGLIPLDWAAQSHIQPWTLQGWGKNLFQRLITLIVRNFCLIFILIPSFDLRTFPLVPPLHISCPISLSNYLVAPSGARKCRKVSPEPSLFQAEQPKLFQPGTMREMLQSSDHLHESPLDLLQFHILGSGCSSWLCWALHEFTESTLPTRVLTAQHNLALPATLLRVHLIHVTSKDIKQCQSQHQSPRNTTCHWSPLEHWHVDSTSLSETIHQFLIYWVLCLSHDLRDKNAKWHNV